VRGSYNQDCTYYAASGGQSQSYPSPQKAHSFHQKNELDLAFWITLLVFGPKKLGDAF